MKLLDSFTRATDARSTEWRIPDAKIIKTAAPETLLSIDYTELLAFAVQGLAQPRRRTPDWLADVIFGWLEDGGIIVDHASVQLPIEDDTIDVAHGRDGSFSCISAMKRGATVRRQRRTKKALLLRLQLYDAAFKIIGKPIPERTSLQISGLCQIIGT